MSSPQPIGGSVEFILDDRQKEIRELLELLGPEPVSYFADACRIMSDTTGLVSQTHLTAHLLREIDARVRGVLRPMLAASALPALREAAEEDATHRTQIEAAGVLLGLDEPTIKAWVDYAPDLHRFTHRASLAAPRSVTEFRAHFEAGQAVLLVVLRKLQAIYADARPAVRKLAAKHAPGKRDLTTLKDHIPHSDVILGEFFSFATLAWFPRLRDAGYFSSPPPLEIDEEGGVRYVGWPAARFLARAAASESLREEVVGILEGLDTDNPEARDSTVEAALKMPPTMAARIAAKIASYVREANAWWIPRHSEELVAHLVDGGEVDAALTVTEPLLAGQPHTADWRMRHAFGDLVPKLFPAAGLEGLAMLRSMLSEDLNADGRERNDYSTIWREMIAGGHDMRRRDMLVTALSQSGSALIESGAASVSAVVAALTVDERLIFRRIALHLVAKHPEREIASAWLRDESVFFDHSLEREYAELAAVFFPQLDPDGKNEILAWIGAGPRWRPERLSADETAEFDDYWRLRRLRALPNLAEEWQRRYDDLVERVGDPGDPLAATRIAVWSGTRSPVEKAAILGMDDAELLRFVDAWEPADDWHGPSLEGLANALRDAAIDDPHRFSSLLPQFLEREPIYARHVLYGLDQVLTNGGTITWPPALEFAREAVERAEFDAENADNDEDKTWRRAQVDVCRLILHGLGKRGIPAEMTDAVWHIIVPLTEDPDPSVEAEDDAERRGSGIESYMWNAIRSLAIEAVIQIASWLRDQADGSEWTLPPHIRAVLDRHLDPAHEPTRSVLAIYGRHFNQLYELDREWATAHVHDAFPQDDARAAHREAAWRAFVHGAWFWSGSWAVLEPEYERALLELDAERTEADADSLTDPSAALLGHLLGAYVQECVDLEDGSLLARFFATAPLAVRTRFLEITGMDVTNADSISDDVRKRLQRLWEWRADAVIAEGNASELAPFAWWFGSGKFDDRWSLEQLIRVLDAGGGTTSDYIVTHRLAELLETQLNLVVQATGLLVERAYMPHMVFGASDEFRRILRAALASNNEELIGLARATISRLYAERHVEFSELLDHGDGRASG